MLLTLVKSPTPRPQLKLKDHKENPPVKASSLAAKNSCQSSPVGKKNLVKNYLELELVKATLEKRKHSVILLESLKSKNLRKEL
jgi:hypothetical protein